MWEWIAFAAGIGFGIMGLAAYIKTNLESKQREKDLQVKIEKLEERSRQKEKELQYRIGELMKGQIIDPRLLITREKDLINSSSEDIWILGINALGVFHESFEDIIRFIKNGGKARVLLLNPESEAFKQREKREEGINGEKSGRLRAEYATSIAFCKAIIRLSNKRKSLDLRVYNKEPKVALLVADPKRNTGMLHVNEYPSPESARGYVGEHRFIPKQWPDIFQKWVNAYEAIWDKSKKVNL